MEGDLDEGGGEPEGEDQSESHVGNGSAELPCGEECEYKFSEHGRTDDPSHALGVGVMVGDEVGSAHFEKLRVSEELHLPDDPCHQCGKHKLGFPEEIGRQHQVTLLKWRIRDSAVLMPEVMAPSMEALVL